MQSHFVNQHAPRQAEGSSFSFFTPSSSLQSKISDHEEHVLSSQQQSSLPPFPALQQHLHQSQHFSQSFSPLQQPFQLSHQAQQFKQLRSDLNPLLKSWDLQSLTDDNTEESFDRKKPPVNLAESAYIDRLFGNLDLGSAETSNMLDLKFDPFSTSRLPPMTDVTSSYFSLSQDKSFH